MTLNISKPGTEFCWSLFAILFQKILTLEKDFIIFWEIYVPWLSHGTMYLLMKVKNFKNGKLYLLVW